MGGNHTARERRRGSVSQARFKARAGDVVPAGKMRIVADDAVAELYRLAPELGVLTSYIDISGVSQHAQVEPLLGTLRALGYDAGSPEAAIDALKSELDEQWNWTVEPVAVAREGAPAYVLIRVPEESSGPIDCHLKLEDGAEHEWRVELAALPVRRSVERNGKR